MSEQSDSAAKPGQRRDAERELSARELAELAGTTVRTIHSTTRRRGSRCCCRAARPARQPTRRHTLRGCALFGALRDEGLSLAGIRVRLAPLNDAQALAVVEAFYRDLATGGAARRRCHHWD